jgi:hypothetical protein
MHDAQYDAARPRKRPRPTDEPLVDVPSDVLVALRRGGAAALVCAAASSAFSLFYLAILVGWPKQLAWLLPASLDVYAGVSLYVGYRLPSRHPASVSARRNARLGLGLSVACNGIYHALVLFGGAWPVWVHDSLLVAVSALPPIVVERVLHLSSKVGSGPVAALAQDRPAAAVPEPGTEPRQSHAASGGNGTRQPRSAVPPAMPVLSGIQNPALAEAATATPGTATPAPATIPRQPGSMPAATEPGNVVAINRGGSRPAQEWAKLALPEYRSYVERHGAAPTARVLCDLLRQAHSDLPVPQSERSERNIRAAVEELLETSDAEPDRDEAAA